MKINIRLMFYIRGGTDLVNKRRAGVQNKEVKSGY